LKNIHDGVLDKDEMVDNVQKRNIKNIEPTFFLLHYRYISINEESARHPSIASLSLIGRAVKLMVTLASMVFLDSESHRTQ
jgi:hypothetical protein